MSWKAEAEFDACFLVDSYDGTTIGLQFRRRGEDGRWSTVAEEIRPPFLKEGERYMVTIEVLPPMCSCGHREHDEHGCLMASCRTKCPLVPEKDRL